MIQTREILSTDIVDVGTAVNTRKAGGTFQAEVSGDGNVTATVIIAGSLYGGKWVTLGTIKLAGFNDATDGFIHLGSWCFYRAQCTEISGSNAICTVNMAGESS